MTRDEVLERLDEFAACYEGEIRECKSDWLKISYHQRSLALRAAAELIRQGGWRPIAECGDAYLKHVGKWSGDTWKEDWNVWPEWAKANGYTHFFTEPEPPAREAAR